MPQKLSFEGFKSDNMLGNREMVDEQTAQQIFETCKVALNDLLEVFEIDYWSYFDQPLLVYLGSTATSRSNGIIVPGDKNFMQKTIKNCYSQEAAAKHREFFPIPRYAIYEELAHVLSSKPAEKEINDSDFLQTIIFEACGGIGNAYASKTLLEDEVKRCEQEIETVARATGEEQTRVILNNKDEILGLIEYVTKEVRHAGEAESREEVMNIRQEIGQKVNQVTRDLSVGEKPKKSLAHKLIAVELFSTIESYLLNPQPNSGMVLNPETGKTIEFSEGVKKSLELLREKENEVENLQKQDLEPMVDDWGETKLKKEEPYFIGKSLSMKIVQESREAEFVRMTGNEILDGFHDFIQSRRRYH